MGGWSIQGKRDRTGQSESAEMSEDTLRKKHPGTMRKQSLSGREKRGGAFSIDAAD
jgi:hypothetical protein